MTSACVLRIGEVTVAIGQYETTTRFDDGSHVVAAHKDVCHLGQAQTAADLGYPDEVAMNREHDLMHALLAHWLGLEVSPALRAVALHMPAGESVWKEEAAVMAIQRFARACRIDLVALAQERYGA